MNAYVLLLADGTPLDQYYGRPCMGSKHLLKIISLMCGYELLAAQWHHWAIESFGFPDSAQTTMYEHWMNCNTNCDTVAWSWVAMSDVRIVIITNLS